ncbi:PEGA domain-containing protein [Desulfovibrio aminophilus]|nr:PEGA domain-containing protein [Desulfovibrio aminophilus]MCM0754075.1 PEGA domain-containing protein [Desulfovibrio aminophilus]
MIRRFFLPFLLLFACGACAPTVLTQKIPVSTIPDGARVRADGAEVCTSPCQVELTRNADHILTLTRDGYRQQDVIVRRVYQSEKVMARAVGQGLQTGQFMNNPAWGVNAGVQSMDAQEQTGEAYLLSPSAVSVTLVPLASSATPANMPGLEALDASDLDWLGRSLESLATGQSQSWTNAATGVAYTVAPQPARQENGVWVRGFVLTSRLGGVSREMKADAERRDANQWAVRGAAQQAASQGMDASAQPPRMDPAAALSGAALGAGSAVSVPVVTAKDGSSHTSTSTSADGSSTTTKTTKTSVKGSVSVNPVGAVQAVEQLLESGSQSPADGR